MIRCDLCGRAARCVQRKEIDGKDVGICECCWYSFDKQLTEKECGRKFLEELEKLEEYEEMVY